MLEDARPGLLDLSGSVKVPLSPHLESRSERLPMTLSSDVRRGTFEAWLLGALFVMPPQTGTT